MIVFLKEISLGKNKLMLNETQMRKTKKSKERIDALDVREFLLFMTSEKEPFWQKKTR
jgi:hypothetical protein